MANIVYYGAVDAFLFDNTIKSNKNINKDIIYNNKLIYFESKNIEELITKIAENEKSKVKKVVRIAKQLDQLQLGFHSKADFIKHNVSNKYIISYHKKKNNFIHILKKEIFHNEYLDKYLLLV